MFKSIKTNRFAACEFILYVEKANEIDHLDIATSDREKEEKGRREINSKHERAKQV